MTKRPLMHWLYQHRDEVGLLVVIPLMAVSVFLFFKAFFDTSPDALTIEILAALLGSIVTVFITMMVIKRQGSISEAHQAASASKTTVFEKKLELFRQFIEHYVQAAADAHLDETELADLEELALTISLFTKDVPVAGREIDLGEELCRFVLQLEIIGLTDNPTLEQRQLVTQHLVSSFASDEPPELISFVQILELMKVELGIAQSGLPGSFGMGSYTSREYEWAKKLLDYRGYRPDVAERSSSEDC